MSSLFVRLLLVFSIVLFDCAFPAYAQVVRSPSTLLRSTLSRQTTQSCAGQLPPAKNVSPGPTLEANLRVPDLGLGGMAPVLESGTGQQPVPCADQYIQLTYQAYIPVDHILGPSPCLADIPFGGIGPLYYIGDASVYSERGYRVQQFSEAILSELGSFALGPVSSAGLTVNFSDPSPVSGGDLTAADFDAQLHDCYLRNDMGRADTSGMGGTSSTPSTYEYVTYFGGLGQDPLEIKHIPFFGIDPGISWVIDVDAVTDANYVQIAGQHTCYPAHSLTMSSYTGYTLLYSYLPPYNNTAYLIGCLTGLLPEVSFDRTIGNAFY